MRKTLKKSFASYQDLPQYGLQYLTGEACHYAQRGLFDLNEDGCKLVQEFFGLCLDSGVGLHKNMNSMVGDKPALASIMLPRATIRDLVRFAMFFVDNCDVVVEHEDGTLRGLSKADTEDYYERWIELAGKDKSYTVTYNAAKRSTAPAVGSRNVHQFSGRTA